MTDIVTRIAALPPDKQAQLLQQLQLKQKTVQPVESASPRPQISEDGWIVRYEPDAQATLRLFCFPYAGGGASIFRSWPELLPAGIEVCAVQFPGHEYRLGEQAYTRLTSLVQALATAIHPYLDKPFAFFGHSMGALVSFELARRLRKAYGVGPVRLLLAAFRAPQLPNPNIKIYHLPEEVFKVVLRAEGIPERILQNEEIMQAMLPTLRADFELCDTYTYTTEPPLEMPFSIFGGLDDIRISTADLDEWRIHSSAPSSLLMLPGSHFFIHSAQDLLLAAVSQDLKPLVNALPHNTPSVLAVQSSE